MNIERDHSTKQEIVITEATEAHVDRITEIYNHHILYGVGTFEEEVVDAVEMNKRRVDIQALGLPYLVALIDGVVVGYSYLNYYRTRSAYRFTLEDSIYLDHTQTGKGLGSKLLGQLIKLAKESPKGFRQIVAVVGGSDNDGSINLHKKFGFTNYYCLKSVGFKFNREVDVVFLQLSLQDSPTSA
ncbi:hypothetical protein CYY_009734 [Polysphondylium violaceum]|uniref:N-acetyltransferase domain-containing protein n=1 Tax=Polysphondylium violaceum TaxID=133409 RepID=A0A8J4PKZ5_9MYCE|nr:hypothetical protein CYY_009734 [Polysphondylium violaceum]